MTGFAAVSVQGENLHQKFRGASRILGPTWMHLPVLTVGFLGVQIFWSVEMSYASPYLLSLGLSKSSMAIVFLAGPLSGLIMQPLIGVLADNCTSRFGRRRPYMLLGTIICMWAMLLLGFTRPVASVFSGWSNVTNDGLTIWLAVVAIYLIDFSINAVQAVDRALLVDTLPPSAQPAANAWAARMLGIGSVIGFFVGNIDLPSLLPVLGKSQLEVLSVIVSFLLLVGHAIMALLVKERILLKGDNYKAYKKTFPQELKDMWLGALSLPPVIKRIFIVQFFAWIAWFPILFYSTIYVGDLYKRTVLATSSSSLTDQGMAALNTEATRQGSRALFYSSLVSLSCNVVLPYFVSEAGGEHIPGSDVPIAADVPDTFSHVERRSIRWRALVRRLKTFRVPQGLQVHLCSLWALSHLILAGCMFGTFLTSSVFGATLLITITGFSWAITQWAPFSLLGEAILTEPASADIISAIGLTDTRTRNSDGGESEMFLPKVGDSSEVVDNNGELDEHDRQISASSAGRGAAVGDFEGGSQDGIQFESQGGQDRGLSSKAGIIIGIHNIFVVVPQFLVTGISAVIFAIFDPTKDVLHSHHGASGAVGAPANRTLVDANSSILTRDLLHQREGNGGAGLDMPASNSVVYVFRLGGVAATVAWILCWRLTRQLKHRGL